MATSSRTDDQPVFGQKSDGVVSKDMVSNVLAVCSHLEADDIVKDLRFTGSVTSTLNRIFDGEVRKQLLIPRVTSAWLPYYFNPFTAMFLRPNET